MNTNGIPIVSQSTPIPPGRPLAEVTPSGPADSENLRPAPTSDRVDLSATARPAPEEGPAAMEARILELRRQIAAGTYLTPEKLAVTVDRLHAELFPRPT